MSDLVPFDRPGNPPRRLDRDLDTRLRILMNKLDPPGTGHMLEPGARTPDDKARLQAHLDHLTKKLRPIDRARLDEAVTMLFIGYPQTRSWSDDDTEMFRRLCLARLGVYPEWAIEEAFKPRSLRADGRSLEFPPGPDVLVEIADKLMAPVLDTEEQVRRVLDAIDPVEREAFDAARRDSVAAAAWDGPGGVRDAINAPEQGRDAKILRARDELHKTNQRFQARDRVVHGYRDDYNMSHSLRTYLNRMGGKVDEGHAPTNPHTGKPMEVVDPIGAYGHPTREPRARGPGDNYETMQVEAPPRAETLEETLARVSGKSLDEVQAALETIPDAPGIKRLGETAEVKRLTKD